MTAPSALLHTLFPSVVLHTLFPAQPGLTTYTVPALNSIHIPLTGTYSYFRSLPLPPARGPCCPCCLYPRRRPPMTGSGSCLAAAATVPLLLMVRARPSRLEKRKKETERTVGSVAGGQPQRQWKLQLLQRRRRGGQSLPRGRRAYWACQNRPSLQFHYCHHCCRYRHCCCCSLLRHRAGGRVYQSFR